jgi:hypothetical protein
LVNNESTDPILQQDQSEEQQIDTSGPNRDLVVFGPEIEPRAANRPINKKIKKREDDPCGRRQGFEG